MRRIFLVILFFTLCLTYSATAFYQSSGLYGGAAMRGSGCYHDYGAMSSETSNADSLNYRVIVPASTLSCSGTQIRISLVGHTENASIISGTSIGIRSGSTPDTTSAPTRITWETGNNGITLPLTGVAQTSDWISFTFTNTNAHLIHIYMADAGTQYLSRQLSSPETVYYAVAGGDDTLVADVSYVDTTVNRPFIVKIEVQ